MRRTLATVLILTATRTATWASADDGRQDSGPSHELSRLELDFASAALEVGARWDVMAPLLAGEWATLGAMQEQTGAPNGTAAGQSDATALAEKTQNPIANLISLPFQNNTAFNVGLNNDVQNVLNIQPVIPVNVGDWNLINRVILPLVYQPEIIPGQDAEFGLGDLNYSLFFSPADSGTVIWGVGPAVVFPTATADVLGSGKLSLGPTAVVVAMPSPWVLGVLWSNIWSVAGDSNRPSVNSMLLQYFVNYNLADGWYLTSAPIITADWNADSDERWVVPIGGGFGKVFRIGNQSMNCNFQAFYNIEDTSTSGDWSIRFQLSLLFPK